MPNLQSIRVTDGCQLTHVSHPVRADIGLLLFGGLFREERHLRESQMFRTPSLVQVSLLFKGPISKDFSLFILDSIVAQPCAVSCPQNTEKKKKKHTCLEIKTVHLALC